MNLQQLPAGNLIRNAFVADEGRLLLSCDFSSQELRWLGELSEDPLLMDIYKNNKDVHSMTGTKIWNMQNPDKQLTYEEFCYCRGMYPLFYDADGNLVEERFSDTNYINQLFEEGKINSTDPVKLKEDAILGKKLEKIRKFAKTVNFGTVYGISAPSLADTLEVSEEEAQMFIDGFFDTYKGVTKWVRKVWKQVDTKKYVTSILGRKRRLYNEINSGEPWQIESAHRMAVNFCIQGSSADQLKTACLKLQPLLKELNSRIVLYIHDELIIDVPENIGVENIKRIQEVMCNAIFMKIGMSSDAECGRRWSQVMSEEEIEKLKEEFSQNSYSNDGEC